MSAPFSNRAQRNAAAAFAANQEDAAASCALIHQRCLNHPEREAVVLCPECRRFFCRECATEHAGRMMCAGCVSRLARTARGEERSRSAMWFTLALGGLLVAWLVFYYFGMALARIPSSFHGGPA